MVCCCVCVQDQEIAVIEQLGRWKSFKGPGINCICWPLQEVVGKVSLVMRELDVTCETKTKDNVFTHVKVSARLAHIITWGWECMWRLRVVRHACAETRPAQGGKRAPRRRNDSAGRPARWSPSRPRLPPCW